ncbi:MAG: hypothetical protein Q8K36_04175, partial [Alphaproteobacteria bacterium]|nr:hypothetical protein [Alphaproteobacteria bacterium]
RVKELTDKLLDGFQLQGLTISYYPEKANTQPVTKNHHYYLFIKLLMNELETTTGYLFIMLLSGLESILGKRYYDDFLDKYDAVESMPACEQPRMLTEPIPQKTGDLFFGIDANDLDFAQTNHKHVYTSLTNQMPTSSSSPSDHTDASLEDVLEFIQERYAQKYTHNC